MTPYFGPEFRRKDTEVQIDTPVGVLCGHCDEPVMDGDTGTMVMHIGVDRAEVKPVHYECSMRSVIGSVGHVEGTCSCNVPWSNESDPPGMNRREAALAAVRAWDRRQGTGGL